MSSPTLNAAIRAFCVAMALLSQSAVAEPAKLKFAFFASDREFAYDGIIKPFVDAVNLEAKGVLQIDIYPSGALGRSYAQQAELVLSGAADMAWIHPALTPERFTDNTVLELPGMFRDGKEAAQVFTHIASRLRGYENFFPIATVGKDPTKIHTRTSRTASRKCVRCPGSPMRCSAASVADSQAFSASLSHAACAGLSVSSHGVSRPSTTAGIPCRMNSHCQPCSSSS